MNCKPGELCRIVGMPRTREANDHFVTTVCLIEHGYVLPDGSILHRSDEGPIWLVRGKNIPMRLIDGPLLFVDERGIGDKFLRPIRDPGDDATDETLLWLPVPSRQRETA